jgi:hypothetical protein
MSSLESGLTVPATIEYAVSRNSTTTNAARSPRASRTSRNSIRHHACDGARERYTVGAWLGRRLVVHFTTGRIRPLNFHTTGDATGDFRYIQYG